MMTPLCQGLNLGQVLGKGKREKRMAFPGTQIQATLNPEPIIAPLYFWNNKKAVENDWSVSWREDGSGFLSTSDIPVMGLSANGFAAPNNSRLLVYGVSKKNFGIADFANGGVGYDDMGYNGIFNGYIYFSVPFQPQVPASGSYNFIHSYAPIGEMGKDKIIEYPPPERLDAIFALTTYNNNVGQTVGMSPFPNDKNSIAVVTGVRNLAVAKTQFEIIVRHFNDGSPSQVYNASKFPENASYSTIFAQVTIGDDIWCLQSIINRDDNTRQIAVTRKRPETFVIDGAGVFNYDIYRLTFADPVIQALLDNYNGGGFLENMWFSASDNGWLITYSDNGVYKLILLEIDGLTYREITLRPKDKTTREMLLGFYSQTFILPESNVQQTSNFKYNDGVLYFTFGDNSGIPLVSLTQPLKPGSPFRVPLPCHNPCIPLIVEKK